MWELVLSVREISDNVLVDQQDKVIFESRALAEEYISEVFSRLRKGQYLSGSLFHNGTVYNVDPTGWGSVWFLKNYNAMVIA